MYIGVRVVYLAMLLSTFLFIAYHLYQTCTRLFHVTTWWRHGVETLGTRHYWPFVLGIHRELVHIYPSKKTSDVSLWCFLYIVRLNNLLRNSRVVGDLRPLSAHVISLWYGERLSKSFQWYSSYGDVMQVLNTHPDNNWALKQDTADNQFPKIFYGNFLKHSTKTNFFNTNHWVESKGWMCSVMVGNIAFLRMMTSSNGNIFCVTGPFCGEFTRDRWIHLLKASDSELWCFLWSGPEQQRLSKQSKRQWFETPSRSLWLHCSGILPKYPAILLI